MRIEKYLNRDVVALKCPAMASDDNVACRRLIPVYIPSQLYSRCPVKMNVKLTLVSEVLPCEPSGRADP